MPNQIPFQVYAKINPERGSGKRMEIQRSRERIAWKVEQDLAGLDTVNLADPGGSGDWGITQNQDGLGGLTKIVAIRPQFGEEPDIISITGFYDPPTGVPTNPPYPNVLIVHDNTTVSGPASGAPGWRNDLGPTAQSFSYVKALKAAIEGAVTSTTIEIIRIDLNGVKYGRGGYHFPH